MKWQGDFNVMRHSLTDWVRLKGGIRTSEVTRDAEEIRAVCSRKENGFNLLNKNGCTLDELTYDAIAEGWLPDYATHDDFLSLLASDIAAKKNGDILCRAWHPSRPWDDLIEESYQAYYFNIELCQGCGNPESSIVYLSHDGSEHWYEQVCDDCIDMLESLVSVCEVA